jgi:hypothetical protein
LRWQPTMMLHAVWDRWAVDSTPTHAQLRRVQGSAGDDAPLTHSVTTVVQLTEMEMSEAQIRQLMSTLQMKLGHGQDVSVLQV